MIIFTVLGMCLAVFFLGVIILSILETRIKNRTKAKFLWNMDKVETSIIREQEDREQDKVVTRTGGLENDRLNERQ